ncbi:MAG: tripartite tricarboxylate transporter permease [Candidatus Micrarchaeia archaeon]
MDFFALAFFSSAGVLAGLSGAVPFLHANLVLQSVQGILPAFALAVFAVSICFSRLCFEAFSSTFLLIPSESSGATLLAGNRMARQGLGIEAVEIASRSFALALAASALILPIYLDFSGAAYSAIRPLALLLLALVVFSNIFSERSPGAVARAFLVFALSGLVGFFALAETGNSALFPLLSGLFGFSSILACGASRGLGRQEACGSPPPLHAEVFAGVALGAFSCFLPAMSPAFLAAFAFHFFEGKNERGFIALNSGIVASKALFDFAALVSFGKARSGAAVAAAPAVSGGQIGIAEIAAVALFSFAVSLALFRALLPRMLSAADKLSENAGAFSALLFSGLFAAVFLLSGGSGLLVAGIATAAGLLPFLFGVRRSHSMGALIVPAMVFLLSA